MLRIKFVLAAVWVLASCSNTPPIDEQVIENSPTHPKVSQRPVSKINLPPVQGEAKFRPNRYTPVETIQLPSGSLFNPSLALGLYKPSLNYQIGDMIMIKVDENTSANKSLKYKTDKKGSFELQPVTLNAGSISIGQNDLSAKYEQENDFNSSAKTQQKNSLEGDITVYIIDIMGNGNLLVAGEKWITLNTGQEFIRFSGEVRVSDISKNNTIESVKVGNSHIEYSGVGTMQDNQKTSLLGKLFEIFN